MDSKPGTVGLLGLQLEWSAVTIAMAGIVDRELDALERACSSEINFTIDELSAKSERFLRCCSQCQRLDRSVKFEFQDRVRLLIVCREVF